MSAPPWIENAFRPLVLGLMGGCVALSLLSLARMAFPDAVHSYLVPFYALVVVEAYASCRLLEGNSPGRGGHLRERGIELAILLVLLQGAEALATNRVLFVQGVPQFDARTWWFFVLAVLFWLAATGTTRVLTLLGDSAYRDPHGDPPMKRLTFRVFACGLLLFLVAALSQASVERTLHIGDPTSSGPLANVLLYFVLGMVLLGQARFADLHQRWNQQGVKIGGEVSHGWIAYLSALLGLVLLCAFLLPGGATGAVTSGARGLWDEVIAILLGLFQPVASMLSHTGIRPQHIHPPRFPTPLPIHHSNGRPHAGNGGGRDWSVLARTLFFWGTVLAAVLYLGRMALHRHLGHLRLGRLGPLLLSLSRLWTALRTLISRSARTALAVLPRGIVTRLPQPTVSNDLLRLVRPGALTPRRQVFRYYRAALRRAEREGVARRPPQTPREFEAMLAPHLTEGQGDLTDLTAAFIEARYSPRPVSGVQAGAARAQWHRLRSALRRLRP